MYNWVTHGARIVTNVISEWALERIEKQNDIFITKDESWHEVAGPLHKKGKGNAFGSRKISIPTFCAGDLYTSFQA